MNIQFDKEGNPSRKISYGIYMFVSEWCVLEDCMQPECHNCFPVKDCKNHDKCKKEGQFELIPILQVPYSSSNNK